MMQKRGDLTKGINPFDECPLWPQHSHHFHRTESMGSETFIEAWYNLRIKRRGSQWAGAKHEAQGGQNREWNGIVPKRWQKLQLLHSFCGVMATESVHFNGVMLTKGHYSSKKTSAHLPLRSFWSPHKSFPLSIRFQQSCLLHSFLERNRETILCKVHLVGPP